ncbi:clpC, partial [Symbiodinium microadriaticum]
AIDVMDEAGARVQLRQNPDLPEAALEARKELREMEAKKEEAVRAQNYEEAAKCRAEE